jgi:Asp/Glu/hydantoin racemase
MEQAAEGTGSPRRIWYQSFTDPEEQRPYIERLGNHLTKISDLGFTCEVHGVSPPDKYFHPITEFRIAGQVIQNTIEAERQGYSAFISGHFQEPGLNESKAAVDIPVLGLGESTMLYACALGRKIGLVTIDPIFVPWLEDQIVRYGLTERVVGVRAMKQNVDDFMRAFDDSRAYDEIREQFLKEAEPLLHQGVEVIVPAGGLTMLLFSEENDFSVGGAPVLNGITVVTKMAELAVKLRDIDGTSVSRAAWFSKAPPEAIEEFLQSR